MPTFVFNDDFSSYPLGPGFPSGWANNGSASGEFDQPASPTPAPGYYEKSGNIFKLTGQMEFPPSSSLGGVSNETTVWWTTIGIPDVATAAFSVGQLELCSTNPTTQAQAGLVSVILEADYTISVAVNGAAKVNTEQQVIFPFTWQQIQFNAIFGSQIVGGINLVTVAFSLAVNGAIWINRLGSPVISGTQVANLWNAASSFNQWLLTGANQLGANTYFSEIAATTTNESVPSYPNPALTVNSLVSQLAIDVIKVPPFVDGRVTQVIVETAKIPTTRFARMTQIIVEIIKQKSITAGGWNVYEA